MMRVFTLTLAAGLFLTACNEVPKESKPADQDTTTPTTANQPVPQEVITKTVTNPDGTKLDISFDDIKNTATVIFNNETIDLTSQKPASGIWYKNDHYELRGKGEDVELKKDGKIVFTHKGEKVIVKNYKSNDGKEMTVNVYNSNNTATVVLDGETIDLTSQKPASGVWYKNDHYELRGKGEDVELKKDGKTIFKSI